jgi:hypothetical protein
MPGPDQQCDIVMKGGVTSGVIYPGAVIELGKWYRFRNVGGTSAGAIAAGLAAAAEYSRQTGKVRDLATPLNKVRNELGTEGFLAGLFQPTRPTRPTLRIMLTAVREGRSPVRRVLAVMWHLVWGRMWLALPCLVAGAGLVTITLSAGNLSAALKACLVAVLAVGSIVTALILPALWLAWRTTRALGRDNFYGMCLGLRSGGKQEALTEWLHKSVQEVAGKRPEEPLTFNDLAEKDKQITLQVMTTDLTHGRPLRLPLNGDEGYWYSPDEFRCLFPEQVVEHLRMLPGCEPDEHGRVALPAGDLPVVVAMRMSLSFPLLISAVPLYQYDKAGTAHECWLSDGGITSNFPVHFFDAWVPERPTFGLDLRPHRAKLDPLGPATGGCKKGLVSMIPDPYQEVPSEWWQVQGLTVFLRQIVEAGQNWRDSAQAELPGYRDRICRIELDRHEGGLNLNMGADTVRCLMERGEEAGETIARIFQWDRHRCARFVELMRLLEHELELAATREPALRSLEAQDLPTGLAQETNFLCRVLAAASELFGQAGKWPQPPLNLNFENAPPSKPPAALRIGPKA